MKTSAILAATAALALPAIAVSSAALAASPFDGTWKTDPASASYSGKPSVYVLKDGVFACDSCTPPYKIKVDGTPQPYAGATGYVDSLKATAIDAHTLKIEGLKAGQGIGVQTLTVSPDGKTYSIEFTSYATPGVAAFHTTTKFARVAMGPAGSAPLSGTWRRVGEAMSANFATNVFKVDGADIYWSSPVGQSYHAVFGGKAVPIKGDKGGTLAELKKVSDREIIETDIRADKTVDIEDMTVSADGKTMTIVDKNPQSGSTATYVAHKI
jgi:hypothetical protein